jgi:hypothetical protein
MEVNVFHFLIINVKNEPLSLVTITNVDPHMFILQNQNSTYKSIPFNIVI